jgi:pSer/pThr/pTyr-binding forkhead associated (FHA) protein
MTDNAADRGRFGAHGRGTEGDVGERSTAAYGAEFAAYLAALEGEVRRGPDTGARFLLDSDATGAGRHPDADIFLDDVTVSRRHAEFIRRGNTFELRDLGSLNGTYYEGSRIEGSVVVRDRSEVQIGKFRLTFYASRVDLAAAAGAE